MALYDLKPLHTAVANCALAEPLRPIDDHADRRIAEFRMQRSGVRMTVDARRKRLYPHDIYLYVARIDNVGMQRQGQGTTFMHQVFDIADHAGVELVTLRASEIGRYAHAANYVQCHKGQ